MPTINVSEATGPALDWLVWTAAGGATAYPKTASGPTFLKLWKGNSAKYIHPSTDWAQGGPIIEREGIGFFCNRTAERGARYTPDAGADWRAFPFNKHHEHHFGTTPLIAAMRCYVASKLGDEIEVPEELM